MRHPNVVSPLDGKAPFEDVHALCNEMAALFTTRHPDIGTTEFYKKDRKGRLFFDTLRNAQGATFVAPYSLRGKPGAPVSAPVTWDEVESKSLEPDGYTLRDVPARLDEINDPWGELRAKPGSVAKARKKLAAL